METISVGLFDGKETGEWKFYHENGELHHGAFKNGKQDGEWHFIQL
jgi:antitoxin component YwqK of YwqJK toxin-antitoxin module